ncbi:hypothetical protein D3C72_2069510 [compost metagenome]
MVSAGLKFSWDLPKANSQTGQDQAMLLAYGTISRQVQSILYGPKRIEGEAILPLSSKMQEEPLETYISFISADRQNVANSVYLRRIEPIA